MPKYAPPREDGLKPWVVERSEWGRKSEHIVYAATSGAAVYQLIGRSRYGYGKGRRATPADIERLSPAAHPRFQAKSEEDS